LSTLADNLTNPIGIQMFQTIVKIFFVHRLRVKVRYDENFKAKFGDDSVNAVRRVMAHAQNIWMWKASLTTTVTFQIDPEVDAIPGKYVAETDL
jgi:hypothetical protein